jgi:glutamate--cysteine ligase
MIVPDPADAGPGAAYSIIELNFNPALHIHDFPETGENRHVERPVLDLLGFPEPATPAPTIAAP